MGAEVRGRSRFACGRRVAADRQRGPGKTWGSAKITCVLGASLLPQSAMPAARPAIVSASADGPRSGQERDGELLFRLLPHLRGLYVDEIEATARVVVIWARSAAVEAPCPSCGAWSSRVHSRYQRRLGDGAIGGRPVVIRLTVRRFFCAHPGCRVVTFVEQVAGLTGRYLRRSLPLLGLLAQVALALAGRAGARLAGLLGMPVHRTTLLRLVVALPDPTSGVAPPILGVDDFAFRKGQVYGTVLVDVATGEAIDVLPDREAATFENWLTKHPGATVICRDRAGNYAEGAKRGAPDSIQVADRWHLWHNLGEYVEKTVATHRACLATTPEATTGGDPPPQQQHGDDNTAPPAAPPPEGRLDVCGRERRLVTRTRERHAAIHELLDAGQSLAAICRILHLDRKTVQRFAREPDVEKLLVKATSRQTRLDPFKPYLNQRWNDGITDAAALHAEITARGFTGSVQAVRRYVRPFRTMLAAPPPAPPVPKTRQITRWLLSDPDRLQPDEQAQLDDIHARCPHLQALAGHVTAFATMMTGRTGDRDLDGWLTRVEADEQSGLRSFAVGIRHDHQAVTNGLTLPYSSGTVEGTVNKIKMLKRQMYGRAGFHLL
ncbi:MAG: ISL3 family transposase, partial [Streptosporangiales bacterium]